MSSSNIEQLIKEMRDYLDGCSTAFFSQKIMVDREQMEEFLDALQRKIPEEIKTYRKILSNRDAILADAKSQANGIIEEAKKSREQILKEHEIVREAYQKGDEIVRESVEDAQKIVDKATIDANDLRQGAMDYTKERLSGMRDMARTTIEEIQERFQNYLDYMNSVDAMLEQDIASLTDTEEEGEQEQEQDFAYDDIEP